ncbi:unnamed protein product, partial [marine sediment metagenome]
LVCAFFSMVLLYGCCLRLELSPDAKRTGLFATALFGLSFIAVRHAGTQEVYTFQAVAVLLALYLGSGTSPRRGLSGGFAFGVALTVHSSCLFVAPAMVAALWTSAEAERSKRVRLLIEWSVAAVSAASIGLLLIHFLMAYPTGAPKGQVFLEYVRGIVPPFDTALWSKREFWMDSIVGQWIRLTSSDVLMSRAALGSGPTGLSAVHLGFAAIGLLAALRISPRSAVIWGLYPVGFLSYEIVFVPNVDFGL